MLGKPNGDKLGNVFPPLHMTSSTCISSNGNDLLGEEEKRHYNFTCNRDIAFTQRACVYHKTETAQYSLYSLDTIWFLIRIRYTIFSIYWKAMIYQKKLCQMSRAHFFFKFFSFLIYCVFYERVQTDIEDIPSEAYKVTFLKNK